MDTLKAFACHSSHDSEYVLQVCAFLKRHMTVFAYEEHQRAGPFIDTIVEKMAEAHAFVLFFGETFKDSPYLISEVQTVQARAPREPDLQVIPVVLHPDAALNPTVVALSALTRVTACAGTGVVPPSACAKHIVELLTWQRRRFVWNAEDDLPVDPHLFSYEKDIIRFFARSLELEGDLYRKAPDAREEELRDEQRLKIANGCPARWPEVVDLTKAKGAQTHENQLWAESQGPGAMVATAAKLFPRSGLRDTHYLGR